MFLGPSDFPETPLFNLVRSGLMYDQLEPGDGQAWPSPGPGLFYHGYRGLFSQPSQRQNIIDTPTYTSLAARGWESFYPFTPALPRARLGVQENIAIPPSLAHFLFFALDVPSVFLPGREESAEAGSRYGILGAYPFAGH